MSNREWSRAAHFYFIEWHGGASGAMVFAAGDDR
jgi:hypothetical protein